MPISQGARTAQPTRLELVVTLGPASWDLVPELGEAGATAFRLNTAHLATSQLRDTVQDVRRVDPERPIVIDLGGAKMRLGEFEARMLSEGDRVTFARDPAVRGSVPVPHPELFHQLQVGETLSVDDGRARFVVESVGGDRMVARSLSTAVLPPRKGINVEEHPVVLSDLGAADAQAMEVLADQTGLSWALSFVADGSETAWLRRRAPGAPVIAKVERARALDHIVRIESQSDSLWICRGDLGAQIGPARLARWVATLRPADRRCPVLMAGQVFEHLTAHLDPTRSEVCHLYDLLHRGYAGIVLSEETAVGAHPVHAVRTVASLMRDLSG